MPTEHELPGWPELVELMCKEPRPPFRAVVVERRPESPPNPTLDRRVVVLHDGDGLWFSQDGDDWNLGGGGEGVFFRGGKVEGFRGFGHVSFDNNIKSMFHGRRMSSLPRSQGVVVGTTRVAGRDCWLADVRRLRSQEEDVVFQFAIDVVTGFVLSISRVDTDDVFARVEEIVIGEASSPPPRKGRPPPSPRDPGPFPARPRPRPPDAPRPVAISKEMSDAELRRALFGDEPEQP